MNSCEHFTVIPPSPQLAKYGPEIMTLVSYHIVPYASKKLLLANRAD